MSSLSNLHIFPTTLTEKSHISDGFNYCFPKFSYVPKIVDKKIYNSDIVCAVPKGTYCFLWFTMLAGETPCCVLFETSRTHTIIPDSVQKIPCCFNSSIAYGSGTLLYGCIYKNSITNRFYFTIETIYAYSGTEIIRQSWKYKLETIHCLLSNMINNTFAETLNPALLLIGLPFMTSHIKQLFHGIRQNAINYPIKYLQFIQLNSAHHQKNIYSTNVLPIFKTNIPRKISSLAQNKNSIPQTRVFIIKPTKTNDIYHMYSVNRNKDRVFVGPAYIKTYENSVMMNSLFRDIKENNNLDALEESDDEDEQDEENEFRFVHMDREYAMMCEYNSRFNKWCPVRVATATETVFTSK